MTTPSAVATFAGLLANSSVCVAYVDTFELFFFQLPAGLLADLSITGCSSIRQRDMEEGSALYGTVICINGPTLKAFNLLEEYRRRSVFTVCRLDLAFDVGTSTKKQALAIQEFWLRTIIVRHQQKLCYGSLTDRQQDLCEDELYGTDYRSLTGAKRLASYSDKFGRKGRTASACAHLELRTFKTRNVETMGLSEITAVKNLSAADVAAELDKHLRFVNYDAEKHRLEFFRKEYARVRKNDAQYRLISAELLPKWKKIQIENRSARLRDFWRRLNLDHVQTYKEIFPRRYRRLSTMSLNRIERVISMSASPNDKT